MPVFNFDFSRSVTNVDPQQAPSGIGAPTVTSLELYAEKLFRFNDFVRRVAPGKPAFTADQIAGAARRVLRAALRGQDSAFIKARMRRAGEIRAALADAQWDIPPVLLEAMRAIAAYLDDDARQLIPNSVPVVGPLDDAILIDAAMDLLHGELDDYADFCRCRTAEAANLGVAPSAVRIERQRWHEERQREQRFERQLRRARDSIGAGDTQSNFRIC